MCCIHIVVGESRLVLGGHGEYVGCWSETLSVVTEKDEARGEAIREPALQH